MKNILTILLFLFISNTGYSQQKTKEEIKNETDSAQLDSTKYKPLKKVDINKRKYKFKQKPLYRPTRLGSSSPLYDTYKKNDYGAGAITTNPNKSGRSFIYSTSPEAGRKAVDSILVIRDSIFVVRDTTIIVKDSIPSKKN